MSYLSQVAKQFSNKTTQYSIIEFAEKKSCLNIKLLPQQRFLLRVLNKDPLDNTIRDIELRDKFGQKAVFTFTEVEFYEYLRDQGRFSLSYDDYLNNDNIQICLSMGRRSTKSTTITVYIAYKLYEVLNVYHPQEYFGILPTDTMNITMVALGEDNAGKLFSKFVGLIRSTDFFKPFILEEPNQGNLKIWTQHDLERIKGKTNNPPSHSNSINILCSSNSPGLRGDGNMFCVMDEFAHFNVSSKSSRDKPLDEAIYQALTPSAATFKYPTGEPFGKTLIFSSPAGKKGKFFSEYNSSYELGVRAASLSICAPTWEMNPVIHPAYLKAEYEKNPRSYKQEYGAEFGDESSSWISEPTMLYRMVDTSLEQYTHTGRVDRVYYLGCDFALSNDGTAVAISHYEPEYVEIEENVLKDAFLFDPNLKAEFEAAEGKIAVPKYVVDYYEVRYAGKPPWEDRKVLLIDEVLDWVEDLYKRFPIRHGIYDQWSGAIIEQLVKKRGLRRFEMLKHNSTINDSQYKCFYMLLHQKAIKMAYSKNFLKELQTLQVEDIGGGIIRVGHPNGDFHDDLSDAVFRSLYLAFAYTNKHQSILQSLGQVFSANNIINRSSSMNGVVNTRVFEILKDRYLQSSKSNRNPKNLNPNVMSRRP